MLPQPPENQIPGSQGQGLPTGGVRCTGERQEGRWGPEGFRTQGPAAGWPLLLPACCRPPRPSFSGVGRRLAQVRSLSAGWAAVFPQSSSL